MDPASAFLALTAAKNVAGGIASFQDARQSAQNDELQAFVSQTRALERDANTRDELNRTLGGIRSAIVSSGLSLRSPTSRAILGDAADTITRERLIQRNDDEQVSANFRRSARYKRRTAAVSLVTGAIKAGPSLVSLME